MSWQNTVRRVVPYVAGEQPKDPGIIKLNTNECPYPPSPAVAAAMRQAADDAARFRLYPDMDATPLVNALAARYGVAPEQIFVGVGSDDVLSMSFLTFFTGGGTLLFPDITYSFYDVWADLYRIPYRRVPLKSDFTIDPEDYISSGTITFPPSRMAEAENTPRSAHGAAPAAGTPGKGEAANAAPSAGPAAPDPAGAPDICGIVFPNPNAPTGAELPQDAIERIVAANRDKVVIVDEAYIDFGGTSALPLLKKYDNLLIVQTFSKSRAMAGARIGFAIGNPELIGYLKDVKFSFNSYTMSYPAILAGTAAVQDERYFAEITGRIVETRERFKGELRALGFEFPDSKANFVFARRPGMSGQTLYDALRARNILVRHWEKPRIADYLRITIGTDAQMDAVTAALKEILG